MILVDTNIPLRLVQGGHLHQQPALDALALLTTRDNEQFAMAPQCLYEMYVVCTRPAAANGMGMSAAAALNEIGAIRALFQLLPETPNLYQTWEGVVRKYAVVGKPAHDARLVAFMVEHQIQRILTFNDQDMTRYAMIKALNPFDILGVARV
jgi:predicted nucleic acid-binding protein